MQVADESEVFSMLDEAPLRAAIAKHQPDLIVPEIEAIRTEVCSMWKNKALKSSPAPAPPT